MTASSVQNVVKLASQGVRSQRQGQSDEASFQKLAELLSDVLERSEIGENLTTALQLARSESPDTERYLARAMRVVGGAQHVSLTPGADEWLHLLALPVFLYPANAQEVSEVLTHLECRAELERSLEQALGLGFASIRLCDYPVSAIDMEQLDMARARLVALDLLSQGDSAYLTPPVVDVGTSPEGAHHMSLLWPAVWKVRAEDRDQLTPQIANALHKSASLAQFKHRADELIERELQENWNIAATADVYMPTFFHDTLSVFRLVELNLVLTRALKQYKQDCLSVSFGIWGDRLRYTLHDAAGATLTSDEVKAPQEAAATVSAAVRAACARHGVACVPKLR